MDWTDCISYFFGGAFFSNAIPHVVSGMMGRSFQSPFANPPGEGLSSSTVNVVWGFVNVAVGYILMFRVGTFDPRSVPDALAVGIGAVLIALFSARHFGKFHGGISSPPNRPHV